MAIHPSLTALQTSSHQRGKSETDDDSDEDDDDDRAAQSQNGAKHSIPYRNSIPYPSPSVPLLLLTPLLEALQLPRTKEAGAKTMMVLMMLLELHNCKMEPKHCEAELNPLSLSFPFAYSSNDGHTPLLEPLQLPRTREAGPKTKMMITMMTTTMMMMLVKEP